MSSCSVLSGKKVQKVLFRQKVQVLDPVAGFDYAKFTYSSAHLWYIWANLDAPVTVKLEMLFISAVFTTFSQIIVELFYFIVFVWNQRVDLDNGDSQMEMGVQVMTPPATSLPHHSLVPHSQLYQNL